MTFVFHLKSNIYPVWTVLIGLCSWSVVGVDGVVDEENSVTGDVIVDEEDCVTGDCVVDAEVVVGDLTGVDLIVVVWTENTAKNYLQLSWNAKTQNITEEKNYR